MCAPRVGGGWIGRGLAFGGRMVGARDYDCWGGGAMNDVGSHQAMGILKKGRKLIKYFRFSRGVILKKC